ncbi:MAG: hypothetical protein HW386_1786, partial [Gammaproteobacteria bacterium]|nr:hypothetical protein [Gammaproteobacteria bacterium]
DSGPDQTLINNIFGKPVRIPVMSTALSTTDTEDNGEVAPPYVRLAFNVTTDGRANNIQVLEESDPKSYRTHKTAREIVKSALFRPRLQNGELVVTEGTELLLSGAILQNGYTQYEESGGLKSASKLRNCVYCD